MNGLLPAFADRLGLLRQNKIEAAEKDWLKEVRKPGSLTDQRLEEVAGILGKSAGHLEAARATHEQRTAWKAVANNVPTLQAKVDELAQLQRKTREDLREYVRQTEAKIQELARAEKFAAAELKQSQHAEACLREGKPNPRIEELRRQIGDGRSRVSELQGSIPSIERNIAACRDCLKRPLVDQDNVLELNRLFGVQAGSPSVHHTVPAEAVRATFDQQILVLTGNKSELAKLESELKAWQKELVALEKAQLEV